MSISYPLSMPNIKGNSIVIQPSDSVSMTRSPFSFVEQVQLNSGQMWAAQLSFPPLDSTDAPILEAFLVSLRGKYGTFLLGDQRRETPRGVATGTPVVDGAGQTGGTLNTRGWTADVTGILKAGDYIQLGSFASARLYMVLQDADSDGSGDATLTVWPNLRSATTDGAAITTSAAKGVFRLTDNMSVRGSVNGFADISLSAIEVVDGT
jgi:hypothetical protein